MKTFAITDAGETLINQLIEFIPSQLMPSRTNRKTANYVFHSVFGRKVHRYDGIRIFVTGENVTPDFNTSDYSVGFDHLTFGDRYKRIPLYRFYIGAYTNLCSPRQDPTTILSTKSQFCSYVMSNTKDSAPERISIYDALSEYKQVSSGGKWRNNVGGPVSDKIQFQSSCKFALAIENSSSPGYCTEKFAQAAQSNCIPIYWGDPTIAQQFNSKAFINAHEYHSLADLTDAVRQIDQDDTRYLSMLAEPWFVDGKEPDELKSESIQQFLGNIFSQPYENAYRRNRSRWGIKYVKQKIRH
ncbi:MAG: hypothetical protein CMF28_02900 [Kiritimatiellaceae bacterium]|nr:hypothetical protein [Kiritimatiellaceae bacterium]